MITIPKRPTRAPTQDDEDRRRGAVLTLRATRVDAQGSPRDRAENSPEIPLRSTGRSGDAASKSETGKPPSPEDYAHTVRPLIGRLIATARRVLGDEESAWDAVQEALISLWLEGAMPPNPKAWLHRAVGLRSLHIARSRARRRKHEGRAGRVRSEVTDEEPSQRIEDEELSKVLGRAVAGLPKEYREVVVMRTVSRMDYAAIADALRIPVGTVRSRLSRSRKLLRTSLLRVFPDGDVVSSVTVSDDGH